MKLTETLNKAYECFNNLFKALKDLFVPPEKNKIVALAVKPAAPANLVATSAPGIGNKINLTWTAPANGGAGITDYQVQRKLDAQLDIPANWVAVVAPAKATVGDSVVGLVNGTAYVFRVAAKNSMGWSPYSTISNSAVPSWVPLMPTAPTCTSVSGGATIHWFAPANNGAAITGYQVARKIGTTYNVLYSGSTAVVCDIAGLIDGTAYIFSVRAINVKGVSAWSGPSLSVIPSSPPAPPTGLIVSYPKTGSSVTLSWKAPIHNGGSVLTGYRVQRRLSSETNLSFAAVGPDLNNILLSSIASVNGASYVFRVAGINIKGVGEYSANSAAIIPSTVPSQCIAPDCIKGFGQVILNWAAPLNGGAEITNYIVQRKINGQLDAAYVSTNTLNTTLTVSGLTNGTTYVFRINATNINGYNVYWSGLSQPVTPGALPPGVPTNLSVWIVDDTGVSLSWSPPIDDGGVAVTSYVVQAKPVDGPTIWRTISTDYTPGVSSPIDGLDDLAIMFRVAAVNVTGAGAYTDQSIAVTPSNKLFDKSSWRSVVAEPYFSYLNKAADRWYKYIKYKDSYRTTLASMVPNWNGLKLDAYQLFNDSNSTLVAATASQTWVQLPPYNGKKWNMVSFNLYINDAFHAKTERGWINTLTHELGHALGIGAFWGSEYTGTPLSNYFLSGAAYPLTQSAYNSITGSTRVKVPLENVSSPTATASPGDPFTGDSPTINKHWDDSFRTATAPGSLGVSYAGLFNELMIGWDLEGVDVVLSSISIKHLVDLGWEEINPARFPHGEGVPTLMTAGSRSPNAKRLICDCGDLPKICDIEPQELKINFSQE